MRFSSSVAASLLLLATMACGRAETPNPEIGAAIEAAGGNAAVQRFYSVAGWALAWSTENAAALDKALGERARHGLDHVEFLKRPDAGASAAEQDVARTATALAYADALSRGFVEPHSVHDVYTIPRPAPDLAPGLYQALQDGRLAQWLDSLAPQSEEYRALSGAYLGFRTAAARERQTPIPDDGELIHVGDADPRLPEIEGQLRANGYLPPDGPAAATGAAYTRQMAKAMTQLQRDYGLPDDGVIGSDTLAVLNMGPGARARASAVAMERLRWLTRDPPRTRIDVNVATAELTYWREGEAADRRKAIVGKPDSVTPQLQAPLFRLVANPSWTVPRSIENGEIARKGAGYLRAQNMARRDGWIVQQPGPKNALGLVKFDLAHKHAIYLHDTPAKTLFSRSQRQLSHGCVRVEDALGFARMLAEEQGITEQWEQARGTGKETFVKLPRSIPVRLLYHTAFLGPRGDVQLRTDPYGWDDRLAEKLGFEKQTRAQFRGERDDIGP